MTSFENIMTYRELLIKDLCLRLNTNLVCSIYRTDDEGIGYRDEILHGYCKGDIWYEFYFREDCSIAIDNVSKIKPYLLPLSSMTEEQKKEYDSIIYRSIELHCERYYDVIDIDEFEVLMDFYHKYHFDYRDLIPMGLAKDATGLNIY